MTKISELDPAVTLDGSEVVPLVQSDGSGNLDTVRGTVADVANYTTTELLAGANEFEQAQTVPSVITSVSGQTPSTGQYIRDDGVAGATVYQGFGATGFAQYLNLSSDGSFTNKRLLSYEVHNYNKYDASGRFPMLSDEVVGDDSYRYDYLNLHARITDNNLPINRPELSITLGAVTGGYGVTAVTLGAGQNKTGYTVGQTITCSITSNPAAITEAVVTGSVEETSPGSGVYQINNSGWTISNAGVYPINDTASFYAYASPPPGSAKDVAPETHHIRANASAARAGTNLHFFVDLAPTSVGSGTLTNPFTTTSGSKVVAVAHASHGLATGYLVEFGRSAAVGGVQIGGTYSITVTSANAYTITDEETATSSASGGGTVKYWTGRYAQYGLSGWKISSASDASPAATYFLYTADTFANGGNKILAGFSSSTLDYYGTALVVQDYHTTNGTPILWGKSNRTTVGYAQENWVTAINSNGSSFFVSRTRHYVSDKTAGTEDGLIDTQVMVAGTLTSIYFTDGTGLYMNASGVSAPGAGNIGADTLKAKTGLHVNGALVIGPRKTGWGVPTGTLERATYATYTAPNISASYVEAEVQAIADAVQTISRTLGALINDNHASGASSPPHALLAV